MQLNVFQLVWSYRVLFLAHKEQVYFVVLHTRTEWTVVVLHSRTEWTVVVLHTRAEWTVVVLYTRAEWTVAVLHTRAEWTVAVQQYVTPCVPLRMHFEVTNS